MDEPLDVEVRDLLEKRRGDWQAIARDAAAGVSYSWLSKFVNGHIENPGYATLKRLRDYLRGAAEQGEGAAESEAA